MLTKILFTIIVILVVAVVFRHKNLSQQAAKTPARQANPKPKDDSGVQPRTVMYAILALLIVVSGLVFMLHWQDQHQIINLEVTDASGNATHYQAYKKSISGRKFETLSGIQVTLGDSDRLEMSSTE